MSNNIFEVDLVKDSTMQSVMALLEAQNHLLAHQNAALDVMAAGDRAALVTDMDTLARICAAGEVLELMDYGDQVAPAWAEGEHGYNPAMNLCHEGDALLEDGETVHGAYFEWDKTTPTGVPFDATEALYYFDGTEAPGDYYITIGSNYGDGWIAGQSIQFTLTETPAEGDQLYINTGTNYANNPTAGRTWTIYGKGLTEAKQTGTTSEGTSGTQLGSTATAVYATNGRVNSPARAIYGYNRWSQSALRQWLNSADAAGAWWHPQNPWDRPPAQAATVAGFLAGYEEEVYRHFIPIKHVTVACDADGNAEDVTYDRVFLASLEQIYCRPQFAGKEGEYWEYYKRLLGRTSPAATGTAYARYKKYALNAPTSAQNRCLRSASRAYSTNPWYVFTSGTVNSTYACSASRCAPSVFISSGR